MEPLTDAQKTYNIAADAIQLLETKLARSEDFFDKFGFQKHPPELARKMAEKWAAERLHPAHVPEFLAALGGRIGEAPYGDDS